MGNCEIERVRKVHTVPKRKGEKLARLKHDARQIIFITNFIWKYSQQLRPLGGLFHILI